MKNGHEESGRFQQWEKLYKDALFESDVHKMPGRLELAKHAVLDRLEDATYTRKKQMYQAQELEALRDAPPYTCQRLYAIVPGPVCLKLLIFI